MDPGSLQRRLRQSPDDPGLSSLRVDACERHKHPMLEQLTPSGSLHRRLGPSPVKPTRPGHDEPDVFAEFGHV